MTGPPISIVIPSRSRADLLHACLASVLAHRPIGTQIIVVDDGSRDSIISRTAQRFADVETLRLPTSHGFCHAVNAGLRLTRAPIIELLNDDTIVTAGWADAALAAFDEQHIGAVAPLVLAGIPGTSDPRIDSAGDGYDSGGFAFKLGHGERPDGDLLRPRDVPAASGSSVFLRRTALARTGLLPEHFHAYFEDVDLSLRLTAAGYRIAYVPDSVVWHRGGCSHGTTSRRLLTQQSCNEERLFWRQQARSPRARNVVRHAAVLAGKALRRMREGRLLPFALGRLRAWHELIFNRPLKGSSPCLKPLPGPR